MLKRRSNPTTESSHRRHDVSPNPWASRPRNDAPTDTNTTTTTPALSRSHLMLTINGLSPNLKASDFARLSSTELSAWQHAIKKGTSCSLLALKKETSSNKPTVQQQRHPDTYEPLGRYTVTFSTAEAAAAYQSKLLRLHALAQHRSSCRATGKEAPWQDSIPAELLEGDTENNTHGSLEEQVAQYTIALGTTPQHPLDVQRSRVTISKPWAPKLSALVEGDGYGEHPHLVMLDVSPPAASAEDLFEQICKDAETRGTRWGVARPHSLAPPPPPPPPATSSTNNDAKAKATPDEQDSEEAEDAEEEATPLPPRRKPPPQHNQFIQDVLRGRFIVSCSDEAEARRFHRFWNMRQLRTKAGHSGGRCVVRARMMEW